MPYNFRTGDIKEDTVGNGSFQTKDERDCYMIGLPLSPLRFEHVYLDAFDTNVLSSVYLRGDAFPYSTEPVPTEIRLRALAVTLDNVGLTYGEIARHIVATVGNDSTPLGRLAREMTWQTVRKVVGSYRIAQCIRGRSWRGDAYRHLFYTTTKIPQLGRRKRELFGEPTGKFMCLVATNENARRKAYIPREKKSELPPIETAEPAPTRIRASREAREWLRQVNEKWERRYEQEAEAAAALRQAKVARPRRIVCGNRKRVTKEMCAADAKQCKSRTELNLRFKSRVRIAKREGWFDEITAHMPKWTGKGFV